VFANTRQKCLANSKNRPYATNERATISHSVQKPLPKSKVVARPTSHGPRVIDQLDKGAVSDDQLTWSKASLSLDENKAKPQAVFDLTIDEFYGNSPSSTSKDNSQATRSSVRHKDEHPPSRQGSAGESGWSVTHPEWAENWKHSVTYPLEGRDKAIIQAEDIPRLDEGEYLNDNLIEFYIRWLEQETLKSKPENAKRIHIMNTFFYERLTTKNKGKRGFSYEAVERWTMKLDLLSYDYIVIPVNENLHWYLAIICNAPKLLGLGSEAQDNSQSQHDGTGKGDKATTPELAEAADVAGDTVQDSPHMPSPTKKGKKRSYGPPPRKYKADAPRIITLDSLGNKHSPTCTNLKEYLVAEIKAKRGVEIPTPGAIGMTATNIPQQLNSSDCGLFLLNYIEKFLRQPDEFIHGIMHNVTDTQDDVWPTATETRNKIRNIIFDLQGQQVSNAEKANPNKTKHTKNVTKVTSEITKAEAPSTSESRSPEESTSPSVSSEQTPRHPVPEQSVTTPTETSSENISALGSLGAGEVSVEEDESTSVIHKPTRERRPTPFPTGPNERDQDGYEGPETPSTMQHGIDSEGDYATDPEKNDNAQGPTCIVDESGNEGPVGYGSNDDVSKDGDKLGSSEDDEMLLGDQDDTRATRSPARSPSPRLLSDPSFSSVSSSTTPDQPASKILSSSPPSAETNTYASSPSRTHEIDAADAMILGKKK
jgi:hypothetical protein